MGLVSPEVFRPDLRSDGWLRVPMSTDRWKVWLVGDEVSGWRQLVTVHSMKWLVWGKSAPRPPEKPRERTGSMSEKGCLRGIPQEDAELSGSADSAGTPDAEGLFEVKAQLSRKRPWETPHALGDDGKLEMDPAARKWLDEATRKREELAEEARAEAGESDFHVNTTLRET